MKKMIFLLLFIPTLAFAQKTAIPATDPSDTIKIQRLKKNKPQEENGFKMGTAYDMWENISQVPQLSVLSKTIRASGLIGTFKSNRPITLFAPVDEAFRKLPKGQMNMLMKRVHVLDLSALLTCQAVPGKLSFDDLKELAGDKSGVGKLISLGGNVILVKKDGDNLVLIDEKGNKVNIIAPDLIQRNGYIHVINAVLMPKPKVQ